MSVYYIVPEAATLIFKQRQDNRGWFLKRDVGRSGVFFNQELNDDSKLEYIIHVDLTHQNS